MSGSMLDAMLELPAHPQLKMKLEREEPLKSTDQANQAQLKPKEGMTKHMETFC